MRAGDLEGDVETQPETLLAGARLAAEERLEQPLQSRRGNRRTGIADRQLEPAVRRVRGDIDRRIGGAVCQGIGQEVGEELSDPACVAMDRRIDPEVGDDLAAGRDPAQLVDDLAQQRCEQDIAAADLDAVAEPAAREVHDVVDQRRHARYAALHESQGLARVTHPFPQQLGPGLDRRERIAQVMPEDGNELLAQAGLALGVDQLRAGRLGEHLGPLPGPAFGGVDPAQLDQLHDLLRHQPQQRLLAIVELAGLVVEHADRAERQAVRRLEQRAGIEAQVRNAGDQRIVGEAPVLQRIRHDEEAGLQDGMGADRRGPRRFANPEPDLGLEPLPLLVDQVDDGDRRATDRAHDLDDRIELLLARRVEDSVGLQRGYAPILGDVP